MEEFLFTLHSSLRWFVLIFAIAAIVLSVLSATGSRPWDPVADRASLLYTIVLDIQFLVGLILWIVPRVAGAHDRRRCGGRGDRAPAPARPSPDGQRVLAVPAHAGTRRGRPGPHRAQ